MTLILKFKFVKNIRHKFAMKAYTTIYSGANENLSTK